jgi:N-acetylglucosaminyldiphosphoundecaprenol N-acetyl-beta-D-mannosaminyltransferase
MQSVTSDFLGYDAPQVLSVLGYPIHILPDYTRWLTTRLHRRLGCHVITLNAEMTMQAQQNPALAAVLRQTDLVIPDGAGVVLYLRLYGRQIRRCAGIELAESMLRQAAAAEDASVFLFGGKPGTAEKAAIAWQQRLPSLQVAGTAHGYINSEEEEQLLQQLSILQPRLILVGLGVPRQELWIAAHRHRCPEAIWMGVGGSFDIWSGSKERAPAWLANNHLEWLYRLYQEPWRWKRMQSLPRFAWQALCYRLRHPL